MKITVGALTPDDRQEWETLYRGYAEFYQVPMTAKSWKLSRVGFLNKTMDSMFWQQKMGIIVQSASCTSGKCPRLYEEKRLVF